MGSVKNTPRNMLTVLLAAGLFASFSGEAAAVKSKRNTPSEIHQGKSKRNYAEQDKTLLKARDHMGKEQYDKAVALFEEVLAILELEMSEVKSSIARSRYNQVSGELFNARRVWGNTLLRTARMAAAEGRYDDAIKISSEAAARCSLLNDEVERFKNYCMGMLHNRKLKKDQGLSSFKNEFDAKADRIKRLLAEAKTLYKAGDYVDALVKAESVFLIDPTNVEAVEISGLIYRKLYNYGNQRSRMSAIKSTTVTTWDWVEPVFPVIGGPQEPLGGSAVEHKSSDVSGAEKLDKIIFPTFVFDDGDLPGIIEFLQSRSKQYDSEGAGVVIENNLPPGADQVTVSMSLSNVPLSTVLRVLCLKAGEWSDVFKDGVKYTVSDNGSRVTLSGGISRGGMEERIFSVPDILYRMVKGEGAMVAPAEAEAPAAGGEGGGEEGAPAAGADGEGGGEGGDGGAAAALDTSAPAAAGSGAERSIPGDKWKACFKTWLIDFPEGSSVFHDPVRGEITVRNTPENLQLLSVVIGQISSMLDPLVMIEVKAVEISESDYQELGFDWAIANVAIVDGQTGDHTGANAILGKTTKNAQWFLSQGINTLIGGTLSPTRSLSTPIVKNWNFFSSLFGTETPFGSDVPFTVNLTINALCQNNRTETVSAPKIITKATPGPGDDNRAVVNMGKSYYFPESWDELEVDVESTENITNVTITPPQPDFGDSTFVGMQFNVKPRLLSDNETLEVQLKVNASSYAVLEGSETMPEDKWNLHVIGIQDGNYFDWVYPIFMPRFYKRNLDIITHIKDGDTIVVGGMVESQSQTVNDKIPFLGDLPLVGRLFQSSSETMKRTNLLIFLSARLMKNDGTPLHSAKPTGMPDFNR